MIKRTKAQRSGARKRLQIPSAPPTPEETQAIAASGSHVNRGSATGLPMAPEGRKQIAEVAQALADKGGLDSMAAPEDARGQETAQMIAEAQPGLKVTSDPNGISWAQGNLEGTPAKDAKAQISDLIRNSPTYKIPGQGALTNRPGESFDDFRKRGLSSVQAAMQELAQNPTAKIGRTTHSQVIKLARGWLAAGTPDDLSVDPKAMEEEHDSPGSVVHLYPNKDGEWEMNEVDMGDKEPLGPGVYMVRHGVTPWNKETYEKANAAQDATTKIAQYGKSLDFGRIRALANKATYDGHLDDDQVSDAIDAALPSAQDAQDLPLHHIIALASAASPKRQAEYAPLIASRLQQPGSEDAKNLLVKHLGKIGLNLQPPTSA